MDHLTGHAGGAMPRGRVAKPIEYYIDIMPLDICGGEGPLRLPCWMWWGSLDSGGYAQRNVGGELLRVHKVLWEDKHGRVPDGLELDHLCCRRSCVNPDHLEAVTHKQNCRRGMAGKYQGASGRCKNDHPFDGRVKTQRTCRTCRNAANRRLYWRKKKAK